MTRYCSICGDELTSDELDICDNCKASILYSETIDPTIDEFY